MKKSLLLATLLCISPIIHAADLMQVYQQALFSDPAYQQAVSQRLSDQEGTSIARSYLFPQAAINGGPSLNKFHQSAAQGFPPITTTSRGYSFTLSLSQTVFNYAQFKALTGANAISKQADATLIAAKQSLMLRVAEAYFTVLKDEDNLVYNAANKKAFNKQYDQINQQYKVGLKTITDVYTAKASYDTASAAYIAAETTLADDKENLRAITGNIYPTLSTLSHHFPLVSPQPANMDEWVQTAEEQNWSIKAAQFAAAAARENVKQQFGGHVPTVSLQGAYNVSYNNNLTGYAATGSTASGAITGGEEPTPFPPTRAHTSDASVTLNFGIPIFQGGLVSAQTDQARYGYQVTTQKLEQTVRATINTTRQSYLGVIAGIQQINADRQAIKSTISSMEGLEAGYRVGTQTLVDVLNQQQKVFQAETQYATDRYAYVNNLLSLKQAAGTLCDEDLQAINAWLVNRDRNRDDAEFNGTSERTFIETQKHSKKISRKTPSNANNVAMSELSKLPDKMTLAKADDAISTVRQHIANGNTDSTLSP